jgi:hypothetical protein
MASEKRERQHGGEKEIGLGIDWVERLSLCLRLMTPPLPLLGVLVARSR